MQSEFTCPLVEAKIDETICYDIQMVSGPGNLINSKILEDYSDLFNINKVTNDRVAHHCQSCPFNQLYGPLTKDVQELVSA